MEKTVWERCFKKTVKHADGAMPETEYGIDARITRTHNVYNEQNGDPLEVCYYEFNERGTRPVGEISIPIPGRINSQAEAETIGNAFVAHLQSFGWRIEPDCTLDDWQQ